jgi:hypothetical protein
VHARPDDGDIPDPDAWGVGGLMERVFFVEILAWYAWWSDGG